MGCKHRAPRVSEGAVALNWDNLRAERRGDVTSNGISIFGPHDETPHHIQELVRAPRRRFFRQCYNRRLLRWAGHVASMPMGQMPCKLLTGRIEHARPVGCPQMTWGRTLNKTLKSYDLPSKFGQWSTLAVDRRAWQQRISVRAPCPRPGTTSINDKQRELFDG